MIALSEGGIGWVAMLLDRLETINERSGYGKDLSAYGFEDYTRIKHVMSYIEE